MELKFHVKTPYDKLAKLYTKYLCHMTKMTAKPTYGKNPFQNLLQSQKASDLETWYVALGMWGLPSLLKWWSQDDLDLLNVKVKFPSNTFKWEFFWKVDFFNTVEALVIFLTFIILKFQSSRLTFDLSTKVDWSPINILKHNFLRNNLANWNQISYDNSLWLVSQNLYKMLWSHG